MNAPEFQHRSACDWGVMLYGGTDPRTGFEQRPLEFQFFAKFYSRKQIEQKARDLAIWHKREHFAIQEPRHTMARAA